jgi:hypothetical protein
VPQRMPVHFIHISKTGGSAIKEAIRGAGATETRFGKLFLHPHPFTLDEVPEDHHVFFAVRDPIARFASSFYSRLRKGRPKYFRDWTDGEREAFEVFKTPQALASGLVSPDSELRAKATRAMSEIKHVKRPIAKWLEDPALLKGRDDRIVYIARQETLSEDWKQIVQILDFPSQLSLPSNEKDAHQGHESEERTLDKTATRALRGWYAKDYQLLAYCEKLRLERGWGSPVDGAPSTGDLLTARAEWAYHKVKRRVLRTVR